MGVIRSATVTTESSGKVNVHFLMWDVTGDEIDLFETAMRHHISLDLDLGMGDMRITPYEVGVRTVDDDRYAPFFGTSVLKMTVREMEVSAYVGE